MLNFQHFIKKYTQKLCFNRNHQLDLGLCESTPKPCTNIVVSIIWSLLVCSSQENCYIISFFGLRPGSTNVSMKIIETLFHKRQRDTSENLQCCLKEQCDILSPSIGMHRHRWK